MARLKRGKSMPTTHDFSSTALSMRVSKADVAHRPDRELRARA
jgi:hypothetical protein